MLIYGAISLIVAGLGTVLYFNLETIQVKIILLGTETLNLRARQPGSRTEPNGEKD